MKSYPLYQNINSYATKCIPCLCATEKTNKRVHRSSFKSTAGSLAHIFFPTTVSKQNSLVIIMYHGCRFA